jgi:hypothetical protein
MFQPVTLLTTLFVLVMLSVAVAQNGLRQDPCATQKAEVAKLEQWVTYDRQHQNTTLAINQGKFAAAKASLEKCQDLQRRAQIEAGHHIGVFVEDIYGAHLRFLGFDMGPPIEHVVEGNPVNVRPSVQEVTISYDDGGYLTEQNPVLTMNFKEGHRYVFDYEDWGARITFIVKESSLGEPGKVETTSIASSLKTLAVE